jgi:hypothetical protein
LQFLVEAVVLSLLGGLLGLALGLLVNFGLARYLDWTFKVPVAAIVTTTSLTASAAASTVTLTATVKKPDTTTATAAVGNVVFKEGATTVATVPVASGVATAVLTGVADGSHTYTAEVVPTGTVYAGSTSAGASVQVGGITATSTINVTIPNNVGALTLTGVSSSVNLGTAVLDNTARFWESTASISAITIRDTRSTATQWSISIVSGNFTSGANSFTGANLGVTPSATSNTSDTAPVLGSTVAPRGGSGNAGLSTSRTFASSATSANLGEAVLGGSLKLSVPTSQAPGTYTGTLTITAL